MIRALALLLMLFVLLEIANRDHSQVYVMGISVVAWVCSLAFDWVARRAVARAMK